MAPSSVAAKYMELSPFKKSMENPAAYLKFTPSLAASLLEGLEDLFKFIKSVYSNPFFIDHSTILPSELIDTSPSPLSDPPFPPFPTQLTSQMESECFPEISFLASYPFSATGSFPFFLKS